MINESGPRTGSKSRTQEEINSEIDELQSQVRNLASTVSNAAKSGPTRTSSAHPAVAIAAGVARRTIDQFPELKALGKLPALVWRQGDPAVAEDAKTL